VGVGTIKWIWFPEFGLGTVVGFQTLLIASANVVASASWELEAGVSSSAGSRCADPRCIDMLAGVGG